MSGRARTLLFNPGQKRSSSRQSKLWSRENLPNHNIALLETATRRKPHQVSLVPVCLGPHTHTGTLWYSRNRLSKAHCTSVGLQIVPLSHLIMFVLFFKLNSELWNNLNKCYYRVMFVEFIIFIPNNVFLTVWDFYYFCIKLKNIQLISNWYI